VKKGKIQGYNLIQFGGKERQGEKGNKNLGHIYIYILFLFLFLFVKNFVMNVERQSSTTGMRQNLKFWMKTAHPLWERGPYRGWRFSDMGAAT